ncbi:PREDICTED: magnesium transporter MRS2 homolog, mitochondrial isoform X1 [Elephantulus edwardii]|uniref:magnesium transporter MRS2 homolog, mitochondrial isoform X1 n=1 Tax=Elephantulus edwardii TaxID=28737 RepID=UPI0003F07399|nr:PREDICTED: magnesium transporter MRS2 homolog, mitochondrial isoform X1 [Elephantulus edwardii]
MKCLQSLSRLLPHAVVLPRRTLCALALGPTPVTLRVVGSGLAAELPGRSRVAQLCRPRRFRVAGEVHRCRTFDVSQATLASVAPVFTVTKFDKKGNVTSFERKKNELHQELGLQARDLRFQHVMSITARNNRIIMRMEVSYFVSYTFLHHSPKSYLKKYKNYRNLNLEQWLFRELPSQLAEEGQLVTYPLPFEFRAIEALLQYWINTLQGKLNILQPVILETLESLVDPKHSSVDRSKLHILLQNGKSLSELETDIKIFKESILEILDDEELLEELCLTKWSDPQVFEKSSAGIDHAEEMELLLENYYRLAEDLSNAARELRVLIDDSQSIIFINLDSHRNVMMRLNLQLTMGTFSLSLFGLVGVAFGMNLESSLEEDHRVFWLVTGIMFMGSGLIWRRLLSFLGRQLEAPLPPMVTSLPKKTLQTNRQMEVKTSLRPDGLGSSGNLLTNR